MTFELYLKKAVIFIKRKKERILIRPRGTKERMSIDFLTETVHARRK